MKHPGASAPGCFYRKKRRKTRAEATWEGRKEWPRLGAVCKRGRRQRLFSTAKEKRAPAPPLALLTPLSFVIIAQCLVKCKSKVSKLQYFFANGRK
jgi:hypothetical protein